MTYLPSLNIKQIVEIVVGILVTISALVEWNKKLPFQPISSFFRWLGSNLMKSTIEDINTKFAEVNIKFDELEKAHEEKSIELEKQQKANNDAIIELSKKMDDKFSEHLKEEEQELLVFQILVGFTPNTLKITLRMYSEIMMTIWNIVKDIILPIIILRESTST